MKVAFIGQHSFGDKVDTGLLEKKVEKTVEKLITENGAEEFIFGSMIGFDYICYLVVTQLQKKYPNIKRVYRSQFSLPNRKTQKQFSEHFDKCEFPLITSKKLSHIKRNETMIDKCDLLITYYDKDYKSKGMFYEEVSITQKDNDTSSPMSETKIALNYAFRKDKKFVNLFE